MEVKKKSKFLNPTLCILKLEGKDIVCVSHFNIIDEGRIDDEGEIDDEY